MELYIVSSGRNLWHKKFTVVLVCPCRNACPHGRRPALPTDSRPLVDAVELEPEPPPEVVAALVPAVRAKLNQGIAPEHASRQHLAMFVDDNIIAAIRRNMREALRAAVLSAYQCFGYPDADRCGACLAPQKVRPDHKPSCQVRVLYYRLAHDIAKLLGFVRHGAFLCQLGNFTSIRLQWLLNEAIQCAGKNSSARKNGGHTSEYISIARCWPICMLHIHSPAMAVK
jgi:hypothetical protein